MKNIIRFIRDFSTNLWWTLAIIAIGSLWFAYHQFFRPINSEETPANYPEISEPTPLTVEPPLYTADSCQLKEEECLRNNSIRGTSCEIIVKSDRRYIGYMEEIKACLKICDFCK